MNRLMALLRRLLAWLPGRRRRVDTRQRDLNLTGTTGTGTLHDAGVQVRPREDWERKTRGRRRIAIRGDEINSYELKLTPIRWEENPDADDDTD